MNYRNAVIGVGILCGILLIALVYSFLTYTAMLRDKDAIISSLSGTGSDRDAIIADLQNQIDQKDSQINNLNSQVSNLQSDVTSLNQIIDLQKSTVWISDETISNTPNSYTYWTPTASYSGYVVVNVQSSTTSNTYVQVLYNSHGVSYDQRISVGSGGSAVFPILPASIEIRVGNTNLLNGATETVTVTYYY